MRKTAMDEARFAALTAAYGADLGRWPAAERDAALAVTDRPWARAIVADAASLDAWLDLSNDPGVSDTLLAHALYSAPRGRTPVRRRVLWQGLGFLGVGFSGAAAAMLTMTVLPTLIQRPQAMAYDDDETLFGSLARGDH